MLIKTGLRSVDIEVRLCRRHIDQETQKFLFQSRKVDTLPWPPGRSVGHPTTDADRDQSEKTKQSYLQSVYTQFLTY